MSRCLHKNFRVQADCVRLVDEGEERAPVLPHGVSVVVRAWCSDCNEPLRWIGMVKGAVPGAATMSADCFEARLQARVNPQDVCPYDCQDGMVYIVAGHPDHVLSRPCPKHFKALPPHVEPQ